MNDQLQGYLACLIACVGFGSNYVPAKKIGIHDGQLFNVCMACGIVLVGLVQWIFTDFYALEPFAALGGALWALGNLLVPFILSCCGLGRSQLTWGISQILVGWATGKFGLFGAAKDDIAVPALNYLGVGMLLISLALFSQMQPLAEAAAEAGDAEDWGTASLRRVGDASLGRPPLEHAARDFEGAALNSGSSSGNGGHQKRGSQLAGFLCAIVAGVLFGSTFDPPTYLKQQGKADHAAGLTPRHSVSDMDYVLSHFIGIILVTVGAFTIRRWLVKCLRGWDGNGGIWHAYQDEVRLRAMSSCLDAHYAILACLIQRRTGSAGRVGFAMTWQQLMPQRPIADVEGAGCAILEPGGPEKLEGGGESLAGKPAAR